MSIPVLALLTLVFHIAIIFLTKLSVVFFSEKLQNVIKVRTWDLTLKLDKLKIKPWLKKIQTTEPIYENSLFRIPTKTITVITFFTFLLIYSKLGRYFVYDDDGYIINKAYFLKVRGVAYIASFLFFSLLIRLFIRVLRKSPLGKISLSIITFAIYWKVSSNIIGLLLLLIIYYRTGEINCNITYLQSLDCVELFENYNLGIQLSISLIGTFVMYFLAIYLSLLFGYIAYSVVYLYVAISSAILSFITFILYKISDHKSGVLKAHTIVFTCIIEICALIYLFMQGNFF